MKITPERANNLARSLEFDCVDEGEKTDIAAILRWAAEVMKASPMATIKENEGCKYLHFDEYRPEDWQLDAELTIKPEPPEV